MAAIRRILSTGETASLFAALLLVSGGALAAVSALYYLPYILSAAL